MIDRFLNIKYYSAHQGFAVLIKLNKPVRLFNTEGGNPPSLIGTANFSIKCLYGLFLLADRTSSVISEPLII